MMIFKKLQKESWQDISKKDYQIKKQRKEWLIMKQGMQFVGGF
jgi:hypothetical protein